MGYLKDQPLDVRTVAHQVVSPERGGVVTFVGAVRNHHAGRAVLRLEYSAYGPMADLEFARILEEAESRWPAKVAAEHRVGTLEVGDVAVIVVAAAPHRGAAFDACRYVIEEIKDSGYEGRLGAGIVLTGGSANLPTLVQAIQRRTRVNVQTWKPTERFVLDPKTVNPIELELRAPQLAVALGLTLRREREVRS